ncbi:MAG: tRNA glutamyl-Q(34) synthetase GluQRS [Chthoniobacterales bacterium]
MNSAPAAHNIAANYRGRLAPSPTGYLHLGHARTFLVAQQRAREQKGELLLRVEDLDQTRCKPEYVAAMLEDLRWCGLQWDGAPIYQSRRDYSGAWKALLEAGAIYPCFCSRKDVLTAAGAPHEEEPIYPGTCRHRTLTNIDEPCNWRFRVPDGEEIGFRDGRLGLQTAAAGRDFGDFLVWRKDGVPAYELAVVVDDAAMQITEVVRGEDLVRSTFRQLLVYRALGLTPPDFYHTPLVLDTNGSRLAKRSGAFTLRQMREPGLPPPQLAGHG